MTIHLASPRLTFEIVHVKVVVIGVTHSCLAKAKAPTTKFSLGTPTPTYRTAAPPL
jgi:hypothetical protein